MKKYKLIKGYPGSKLKNSIYIAGKNILQDGVEIYIGYVKQYPEFWEEVIKKDYEILSLKDNFNNKIINNLSHLNLNNLYKTNNEFLDIHSVKRLSDGEIFTIGDEVCLKQKENYKPIESFILCDNKILVNQYINGINSYKKQEKPLFTTEDGVDVFNKEYKLFEVILSTFHLNEDIPLRACNDCFEQTGYPSKVFSTKEKAKEYILMNKPCLSLNEIFSIFDISKKYQYNDTNKRKLKGLVKNKGL